MLASQRIALEMSEIREKINDFPDDGEDSKRDGLTREYQTLESRYRAALVTEDTREIDAEGSTAEGRELGRLKERASISDFINEVVHNVALDGASKEFREAVLGENLATYMPVDMLEMRGRCCEQTSPRPFRITRCPYSTGCSIAPAWAIWVLLLRAFPSGVAATPGYQAEHQPMFGATAWNWTGWRRVLPMSS